MCAMRRAQRAAHSLESSIPGPHSGKLGWYPDEPGSDPPLPSSVPREEEQGAAFGHWFPHNDPHLKTVLTQAALETDVCLSRRPPRIASSWRAMPSTRRKSGRRSEPRPRIQAGTAGYLCAGCRVYWSAMHAHARVCSERRPSGASSMPSRSRSTGAAAGDTPRVLV